MLLYRDFSSGGNSTAGCVFSCLDELASGELSGLFLLLLAMLTTVVLEAESSVVRDTLLVLVVLVRLMLLLGSLDMDNWDRASQPRLLRLNRVDNDWEVWVGWPSSCCSLVWSIALTRPRFRQ